MRRLVLLTFIIGAPAAAQNANEIVVTGHGLPASLGDKAYQVLSIDRERLQSSASDRLEDILRDAAGFQQFRRSDSRSAHPTSQGASLRGLGGNAAARALVLLDGVPVADPFGGWIDWPSLVPNRLGIARITRGGGAGPFGSGALAGTIELSSATPDQMSFMSGGIAYGSRDSLIADGSIAGDLGNGHASLSGRYDRGDGFIPIVAGQRGAADHPAAYRQWSTRARAVAPLSGTVELQTTATLFGDKRDRGTAATDNETMGADANLRLIGRGNWAWEALAYLQSRKFSSQFAMIPDNRSIALTSLDQYNTPATGYGAKIELRPPVGKNAELRIGMDYREVVGSTKERFSYIGATPATRVPTRLREAGGRNTTTGGFVEASLKPLDNLTLTGGGRVDYWQVTNGFLREKIIATGALATDAASDDRNHWEPTGRVGIAYNPADAVTLRAAAYTGYRLPTLNELYRPFRVGADATAANSALAPERLKGVEAGVQFQPLSNAQIGATLFWNQLDNAIANVTVAKLPGNMCPGVGIVGGSCRARKNVDAIRAQGVELDASLDYGPWGLSASYAYTDSRVRASGISAALDDLRPAQTPRHQGSITLAWHGNNHLSAALTGRYLSFQFEDDLNQRKLDDAATLDASVAVPLSSTLRLEARGENLTNTRIDAGVSATGVVERALPRTFWLALRYSAK